MAQVGGNLFRDAAHQGAVRPGLPVKDYIGAETRGYGILGAAGLGRQAAQLGNFAGQFLRLQHGRRAQANGHPAIAQGGGPAQSRPGMSANPQRRMRLLYRLGQETGPGSLDIAATEFRVVRRPQFLEQAQIFVSYRAPFGEIIQTQGLKLLGHPAYAHAQRYPALGQSVQGGNHLGGQHRAAVGDNQHMGAKAQAVGAAGQEVEGGQGVVVGLVGTERRRPVRGIGIERCHLPGQDYVVADPGGVKAQFLGPLGQGAQGLGTG